jgi:hypothetical protein
MGDGILDIGYRRGWVVGDRCLRVGVMGG